MATKKPRSKTTSGKITLPLNRFAGIHEGANPYMGNPNQRSSIVHGAEYNKDFKSLVTDYDLIQLRGISRYLYSNLGPVKKAINDMASLSTVGGWRLVWSGNNVEWKKEVEQFVNRTWWSNCNFRGQHFGKVLEIVLISVLRDGECFIKLSEDENHFPKIQCISAHRVGNRNNKPAVIEGGQYNGMEISSGIVYDKLSRPVAYQVLGYKDDGSEDVIVPKNEMIHIADPNNFEEGRSVPALASAIEHWKDYYDIVFFEKRKFKLASSIALTEHNETGTIDIEDDEYASRLTQIASAVTGSGIYGEYVQGSGGETRYFKANSGQDLKVLEYNNPGANAQEFLNNIVLRGAFSALSWYMELSFDGGQLRGAPMKTVVNMAQRRLEQIQMNIVMPLWYRLMPWVVAKSIKHGFVSKNVDWYKINHSPVRELTFDELRNGQVVIADLKAGLTTYEDEWSKYGGDWRDGLRQRFVEEDYIQHLQTEYPNVDINNIRQWYPNPMNVEKTEEEVVDENKK